MVNFPFYRYTYPYYYKNQQFPNFYNQNSKQTTNGQNNSEFSNTLISYNNEQYEIKNQDKENEHKSKTSRYNSFGPINFQNPFSVNSEEPILEFLGIKLYLDDIIILGLLFFLYNEGVKDEMLFLSLILLLLS